MIPKPTIEDFPKPGERYLAHLDKVEYIGRVLMRSQQKLEIFVVTDPNCSPAVLDSLSDMDNHEPGTKKYDDAYNEGREMMEIYEEYLEPAS